MEYSDEQTRKKIKVYKALLGLNPPKESKLSQAQKEVEYYKQLYELLLKAEGDNLPNVLMDLLTNEQSHSPDEN